MTIAAGSSSRPGCCFAPGRTGWQLAELVAPDPDLLIASPSSAGRPVGPDAARDTAMTFTTGYLAYTYGHAGIGQVRGVTSRGCAPGSPWTNPPRVPQTVRALDPRIASLALTPDGRHWLASANVTDSSDRTPTR